MADPRMPLPERLEGHTARYLATLLNCTIDEAWARPVTFQVFDDRPRKGASKADHFPGTLQDYSLRLEQLNLEGCGIFVTPNQTDLKGRLKANITAGRAAWTDIDEEKDTAVKPFTIEALALPPTMVVRSGHGWHVYWIFPKPIPCDERRREELEAMLRGIQIALKDYGADKKVCHSNAVLRLPGFYNMKRDPVLVEVVR